MLAMCKGSTTVAQQAARKQGVALNAAISYSCRICASSWTSRLVGRGLSSSSLPRVVSGNLHDPMGYHNIGSGTTLLQQQDQQLPNTRSARLGRTRSPAAVQPDSCVVPVAAIHAAQTIDLNRIMMPTIKKADNILERQSQVKQMFGKNSIVIRLTDSSSSNSSGGPMIESSLDEATTPRFAAIFRFGSIVYFNVTPADADQMTCEIKKCYATEPVLKGMERKENFGVLVAPTTTTRREEDLDPSTLSATAVDADPVEHSFRNVVEPAVAYVTGDYCMVPEQLDMNGVAVISTIMAQTVALDSYSDTVDELLTNFARINSTVSKTGSFTSTDKSFLFKTVAQNNSIFIDMISKVRIKDRSDTAWNLTKYETIHYGLKEEFELDDRFENIEFKLNLIQKNAKFFLEVLHHQKSNNLEWIIVALILAECLLMCIEMSGMGEAFFQSISGVGTAVASLLPPTSLKQKVSRLEDIHGESPSSSL